MRKHLKYLLPAVVLLVVPEFAMAQDTMGGLCDVLAKIEGVAPIIVKIVAVVLSTIAIGIGLFFMLDRERGQMGKGIAVMGIGIVVGVLIWVFASPLGTLVTGFKGALGCS